MLELKVFNTFEVENVALLSVIRRAAACVGTRAGSAARCSVAAGYGVGLSDSIRYEPHTFN